MADEPHRKPDLDELVRAVRDLNRRVDRMERRLEGDYELREQEPGRPPRRAPIPISRTSGLESRIGSQWLNRIGVIAILFGVAFLLRYAFLSGWLSPPARVWLGVGAGAMVMGGSEIFRARGYRVLSLSLKAVGIGIVYLSLWAGFELYQVLSAPAGFAGLVGITAMAGVLALRESSEVLAALALVGAYLAPLLVAMPTAPVPLFFYLAMVDAAVLIVAATRGWWKLLAVSFAGTGSLGAIWYAEHYERSMLGIAAAGATMFFIIYCVTVLRARTPQALGAARVMAFLGVSDPIVYFAALYLLLHHGHRDLLTGAVAGLAAWYFILAGRSISLAPAYFFLGIGLSAAALAIEIDFEWLSLAWFVEAASVMAIGFWRDLPWLRWGGLVLLCAAILKAFVYDVWRLSLGYRTVSFIGLGVLLLGLSFVYQRYGFALMGKLGSGESRPR